MPPQFESFPALFAMASVIKSALRKEGRAERGPVSWDDENECFEEGGLPYKAKFEFQEGGRYCKASPRERARINTELADMIDKAVAEVEVEIEWTLKDLRKLINNPVLLYMPTPIGQPKRAKQLRFSYTQFVAKFDIWTNVLKRHTPKQEREEIESLREMAEKKRQESYLLFEETKA